MENREKVLSPMLEQTTDHEAINLIFPQTLAFKDEQNSIFMYLHSKISSYEYLEGG